MGDVDMLGKATAAVHEHVGTGAGVSEDIARAVLEAAGVLGAGAQPPPVHQDGEPSMHDVAIEWVVEAYPGRATVLLCRLLDERKAFGLAKYGTVLQVSGSRDPFVDVSDELIDALVYAQQGLERVRREDGYKRTAAWWMNRRDEIARTLLAIMEVRVQRGD